MLDGVTDVPLAPEEHSVGAGRGTEGELVEGEALSTSGEDALPSRSGESESGDADFRYLGHSLVVENGSDSHDGFVVGRVGATGLFDDAREGEGRAVDLLCKRMVG